MLDDFEVVADPKGKKKLKVVETPTPTEKAPKAEAPAPTLEPKVYDIPGVGKLSDEHIRALVLRWKFWKMAAILAAEGMITRQTVYENFVADEKVPPNEENIQQVMNIYRDQKSKFDTAEITFLHVINKDYNASRDKAAATEPKEP